MVGAAFPGRTEALAEIKSLNEPFPPPLDAMITMIFRGCHLPLRVACPVFRNLISIAGIYMYNVYLNVGTERWGEKEQGTVVRAAVHWCFRY